MNKKLFLSLAAAAMLLTACNNSTKAPADNAAQAEVTSTPEDSVSEAESDAQMFTDFKQADVNGNQVSSLEFIKSNKLTIVDFWASWCPPCVREIPNLKAIYEANQSKGLGILSISLDNEEDAWKGAIKKYDMNWKHVSDLKGWENEAAQLYGVQSIPFMMVVNEKGSIVAKDLRGDDLKKFVEDYLK